ncbi:hypothetical protein D3C73_1550970 [compost metagenome]
MVSLTRSPIDSSPSSSPLLTTGRWRRWRLVIRFMQYSRFCLGSTVTTGALMISRTGVAAEERPLSTSLRA